MKGIWIYFLVAIIGLSSVVIEVDSIGFHEDQIASVQHDLPFEIVSLRNPTQKYSEKSHLIADAFIPMVLIAESPDADQEFHHYLPLYQLYRQKHHFLLI